MPIGFLVLLFFILAILAAGQLWQQHNRRAPVRRLENRREDLRDLSEMADVQDQIDEETNALRARGVDVETNDNNDDS